MGIIICITKDTENLLMSTKRQPSEVANGGVWHGSLKYKLRRSISPLWHIDSHSLSLSHTETHMNLQEKNTKSISTVLLCAELESKKAPKVDALKHVFKWLLALVNYIRKNKRAFINLNIKCILNDTTSQPWMPEVSIQSSYARSHILVVQFTIANSWLRIFKAISCVMGQ